MELIVSTSSCLNPTLCHISLLHHHCSTTDPPPHLHHWYSTTAPPPHLHHCSSSTTPPPLLHHHTATSALFLQHCSFRVSHHLPRHKEDLHLDSSQSWLRGVGTSLCVFTPVLVFTLALFNLIYFLKKTCFYCMTWQRRFSVMMLSAQVHMMYKRLQSNLKFSLMKFIWFLVRFYYKRSCTFS